MITLKEAQALRPGQVLLNDAGKRWKVNGHVKLWKTRPDAVRVPLKHGLYAHDQLTETSFTVVNMNGEKTCPWLTLEEA